MAQQTTMGNWLFFNLISSLSKTFCVNRSCLFLYVCTNKLLKQDKKITPSLCKGKSVIFKSNRICSRNHIATMWYWENMIKYRHIGPQSFIINDVFENYMFKMKSNIWILICKLYGLYIWLNYSNLIYSKSITSNNSLN